MPTRDEVAAFEREFAKRARFLIDESLGIGTAETLRAARWNVKYVDDVALRGHPDEDVFAFAQRKDLILLTHDADFLDDCRFPPHRNPGIVVLPGGSGEEKILLRALGGMLSVVGKYREAWRFSKVVVGSNGDMLVSSQDRSTGAMKKDRYRFTKSGPPLMWADLNQRSRHQ
ncbi:MAG: DUF5615 family PIN-like protein [Planctomycetes bacterium]|nr:DUF5615 family PIN-like protein [Planctomycetota bacterium]MBI3843231.1 DUF5615 family PIN-like protein [Planctomycetota bacterium]